jgi:hypothetical protein
VYVNVYDLTLTHFQRNGPQTMIPFQFILITLGQSSIKNKYFTKIYKNQFNIALRIRNGASSEETWFGDSCTCVKEQGIFFRVKLHFNIILIKNGIIRNHFLHSLCHHGIGNVICLEF